MRYTMSPGAAVVAVLCLSTGVEGRRRHRYHRPSRRPRPVTTSFISSPVPSSSFHSTSTPAPALNATISAPFNGTVPLTSTFLPSSVPANVSVTVAPSVYTTSSVPETTTLATFGPTTSQTITTTSTTVEALSATTSLAASTAAPTITYTAAPAPSPSAGYGATWPDTPFMTDGRQIKGASGANIVFAGADWPGAGETMLPEGLQYNSIANIVSKIKSAGLNVIRLTYAIEMIDDNYSDGPNQSLQSTLTNALGADNGPTVLAQMLKSNPSFTAQTTRLEVFDAVAAECAKQQIWVHLDNHVSKAQWCCGDGDGNGWFGDTYFDVNNWRRGLGFMADRAKSWPALSSMSLRNELRSPTPGSNADSYDWGSWYANVVPAMDGIHTNNSLPLIFVFGIGYDTDLSAVTNGQSLDGKNSFDLRSFDYGNKIVFELHNYDWSAAPCNNGTDGLYTAGYGAMNVSDTSFKNHAPVVLTEFGFAINEKTADAAYAQCIRTFLQGQPGGPGGWMQWSLGGSYYIRQGKQDMDESFGLLNHQWSDWRDQGVLDDYVVPFVKSTVA